MQDIIIQFFLHNFQRIFYKPLIDDIQDQSRLYIKERL